MAKKKNGKKVEEKLLKSWAAKILQLLSYGTAVKAMNALIKALKKELALWVTEAPTGKTSQNYSFRQAGRLAGVLLQDNPQYEIDIDALAGKIGLKALVDFISVKRTALVKAIEGGLVSGITLKELENITKTTYGEPKVIPYYGTLDLSAILPEAEEAEEK